MQRFGPITFPNYVCYQKFTSGDGEVRQQDYRWRNTFQG